LEEEIKGSESIDRSLEDHELGFTQVNHQLLKVVKTGEGIHYH